MGIKSLNTELYFLDNEECLKFTFKGNFREEDALEGIDDWKDIFASAQGESAVIIWDCLEMTGFENNARKAWQKAIKDLKNQIECVWLITDSKVIKAGAKVMNAFTSFKLNVVKSTENIMITENQAIKMYA